MGEVEKCLPYIHLIIGKDALTIEKDEGCRHFLLTKKTESDSSQEHVEWFFHLLCVREPFAEWNGEQGDQRHNECFGECFTSRARHDDKENKRKFTK